ncbi:MAG TPA: hypothetical protein VF755_28990 [Catenuloplanes sp.]
MRQRLSWFAALLGIAVSVVSAPAAPACACSCARPSENKALERAELVFDGAVLAVNGRRDDAGRRVAFTVDAVVKGQAAVRVEVATSGSSASCGYEFEVGRRYRVFVTGGGTGLCSGNRLQEPAGRPGGGPTPSGPVDTGVDPPPGSPAGQHPAPVGPAGTGPGSASPAGAEPGTAGPTGSGSVATGSAVIAGNRLAGDDAPVRPGYALGWLAAGAVLAGAAVLARSVRRRRAEAGGRHGQVGPSA